MAAAAFTANATSDPATPKGRWVFQYPPFAGGNDWETTGYLLNEETGELFLVDDAKMTRVTEPTPEKPKR